MIKKAYRILFFGLLVFFCSCNNKKLTEVVEVPLPTAQEKMTIGNPDDVKANPGTFEIVKLPYSYDALAPNIDARTMEIHFSKHYLTYTNNLNRVIEGTDFKEMTIEEILSKALIDSTNIRNNAGAYYNHNFYWECLGAKKPGQPKDTLAGAIKKVFGSFENFKSKFRNASVNQFGSGWAWLIVDKTGKLQITTTPNQDNPLMQQVVVRGTPILGIDLWEHAYYLEYQYKRKNYIDAFFDVIQWSKVEEKYEATLK